MAAQYFLKEMEGRIEQLKPVRSAYIHSYGINSSEDAAKKIMEWASMNGL